MVDGLTAASSRGSERFSVMEFPGSPSYLAARSPIGSPALLIRCQPAEVLIPLQLAGIEARYSVRCTIADSAGEREERLSIVQCLSRERDTEAFFCSCIDQLVELLGPTPSTASLSAGVERLVAMFRALGEPPKTDVLGLIGELCVILLASKATTAIEAWHADPKERYDFVLGALRLEVKTAGGADRTHHLSADQATPPVGTIGVLASVMVRLAGGGTSVRDLMGLITAKLGGDRAATFRLIEGVTLVMGSGTEAALATRFDLEQALQSLQFFDLAQLPALRAPFPDGISDVRFRIDLTGQQHQAVNSLKRVLEAKARSVLPPRQVGQSLSDT